MTLNCFKCSQEVVFDSEHIGRNGKKIPLDPLTKTPHKCPVDQQEKNDHGNELVQPLRPTGDELAKPPYVDHTAKALKLKTITDPTPEGMDLKYNKLAAEHKVKFSQYHPLGSLYTIAVYYEEMA